MPKSRRKSTPKEPKLTSTTNESIVSSKGKPGDSVMGESSEGAREDGSKLQGYPEGPNPSVGRVGETLGQGNTARETATPYLIPRPDGRGALLSGGQPGNKGGGATPDALRGTIRRIIEEHGLPFLQSALSATGTVTCPHCKGKVEVPADPKLMAKLLDTGLRIGVGTQLNVEHQGITVIVDTKSVRVAEDGSD